MPDFRLPSWIHASDRRNIPTHIALFLTTFLCTTWAGAFWTGIPPETTNIASIATALKTGLPFSISLLAFLGIHEFGHYFAARHHHLRATLPYFIPLPPQPFLLSIGTMGAVIRIKDPIGSRRILFDTGAAGPLAGFVVALSLLVYGFLQLPPSDFIYTIHPEYRAMGGIPPATPGTLFLGRSLLFILLESIIAPKGLPPMHELYHYPFLFAGWIGCFVTALNLLPIGQLDGGHIIFAMFGAEKHRKTASFFLLCITILGAPSFASDLLMILAPTVKLPMPEELLRLSWPGWVIWAFFMKRFIGARHPFTTEDRPLSTKQMVSGWICIAIFVLTFTPVPFGIF